MQFRALPNEPSNNFGEVFHVCLHCEAAKEGLARVDEVAAQDIETKKIHGSVVALRRHLEVCPHTPAARMSQKAATHLDQAAALHASSKGLPCAPLSNAQVEHMRKCLVEYQAQHRLPDSFIDDPTTHRLFASMNCSVVDKLPNRRALGGRMLNAYATEVSSQESLRVLDLQNKSGGRVNFIHLLGAQLILFGVIATLGLFTTGSRRHDGLALASQMEKILLEAQEKGWNIGGVVTDDAGQCGRARRILALRWPGVVFLKCFAHDMNNLVKSVLRIDSFRKVAKQAESVVNYLNASSSKWLPRVQEVMLQTYGEKMEIFDPLTNALEFNAGVSRVDFKGQNCVTNVCCKVSRRCRIQFDTIRS